MRSAALVSARSVAGQLPKSANGDKAGLLPYKALRHGRAYCMRTKSVQVLKTGDMVRGEVREGSEAATHVGESPFCQRFFHSRQIGGPRLLPGKAGGHQRGRLG